MMQAHSQTEGVGGITRMTQAELEDRWFQQLARINRQLSGTRSVLEYQRRLRAVLDEQADQYLAVLQDKAAWNNLSFCLRRYLYERFTGRRRGERPEPWTAQAGTRTYCFSPVLPGQPLPGEELERYADLLYQITLENRCYYVNKQGVTDPRKGAVSKQEYRNYLGNKGISRRGLFVLSMALKFDVATMSDVMNALGESPVYNFRDAEECIYYFCHSSQSFQSMEAVRGLLRDYSLGKADGAPAVPVPDLTCQIGKGMDQIIQQDWSDEEALRQAFLNYLVALGPQFTGYSRTARALFREELLDPYLLEFDEDVLDPDHFQYGEPLELEGKGRDNIGNQVYESAVGASDGARIPLRWLDLDERITKDLLNGPRLRDLLPDLTLDDGADSRETVTKKDFLLLRFHKLAESVEFTKLEEGEHWDVIQQFHASTDRVLLRAGLPPIYLANPFEHLIFVALCSPKPLQFLPQIFAAAPRKAGGKTGYQKS